MWRADKYLLEDWLRFASDVVPGCAAGQEWLEELKARTRKRVAQQDQGTRTMTYENQPADSVDCWMLGEACRTAADEPRCGDPIDRGLILLRELESRGYGIVKIPLQTMG